MKSELQTESGLLQKLTVEWCSEGILKGRTFVAKDVIDIEGHLTGFGNPAWRNSGKPARKNARCVEQLLRAGAILKGKSKSDEFALSLDGLNRHYELPINAIYPERLCGGSSSGSATCVASGFVDFALGTDTVGSTRVPAAFNGIYGLRPGFDNISLDGVLPLGKSFDTLGLLAKEIDVMKDVSGVLLKQTNDNELSKIIFADSLFKLVHNDYENAFKDKAIELFSDYEVSHVTAFDTKVLDIWSLTFSIIRSHEAFEEYEDWMIKHSSDVSPHILDRMLEGKNLTGEEVDHAYDVKRSAQHLIESLIGTDNILCLPTIWNLPPLLNSSDENLAKNRKENIRLTILSVISGLPQLSIPLKLNDEIVLSISLLGPLHSETQLLDIASRI